MPHELALPDVQGDDVEFAEAVRMLRDHLLGAVDVDLTISIDGQSYSIAWGSRQPVVTDETMFAMTAGMRVVERRGSMPAHVASSGEEQITIVIDGERLVFHLLEVGDDGRPVRAALSGRRLIE